MQQQKKNSEPMNLLRTQSNTLDIKSERILNRMPQQLPLTMPSTPTSSAMPQVNSLTDENLINEMSSSMASIPTNSFSNKLLATVGTLVFSLYVLYDTHVILQRNYNGDFINASMGYYLDIINLFTNLLRSEE